MCKLFQKQKAILFYNIRIKFGEKFRLTLLNLEGIRLKVIYVFGKVSSYMRKYSVRYDGSNPHK
jgi:hypothetical protein